MHWRERGQHQHHRHAQTHRAQDGVPHAGAGGAQPEKGDTIVQLQRVHCLFIFFNFIFIGRLRLQGLPVRRREDTEKKKQGWKNKEKWKKPETRLHLIELLPHLFDLRVEDQFLGLSIFYFV